jgi:RNA recognition motif-containing protein
MSNLLLFYDFVDAAAMHALSFSFFFKEERHHFFMMFAENRRHDPYNTRVTTNPVHRVLLEQKCIGYVRVRTMNPTSREDYECLSTESPPMGEQQHAPPLTSSSFHVTESSQQLFVGQLSSELTPMELASIFREVMSIQPLRVTRGKDRTCMFVHLCHSEDAEKALSFHKRLLMDTDLIWIDRSPQGGILTKHMDRSNPCQCSGRSALPKNCVTIEKRNVRLNVVSLPLQSSVATSELVITPRLVQSQQNPSATAAESGLDAPDRYFCSSDDVGDDDDDLPIGNIGALNDDDDD